MLANSLIRGGKIRRKNVLVPSACQAVYDAMDVQPDAARKLLICQTITALKSAGLWDKLDLLFMFAAHDEQAGRINWVSPGYVLTRYNSCTFTTDRGFTGDNVSMYLAGGNITLNQAGKAIINTSGPGGVVKGSVGMHRTGGSSVEDSNDIVVVQTAGAIRPRTFNETIIALCDNSSPLGLDVANAVPFGLFSSTRTANTQKIFREKTLLISDTITNTGVATTGPVGVLINQVGSLAYLSSSLINLMWFGHYLDDTEQGQMVDILDTYMSAVGIA